MEGDPAEIAAYMKLMGSALGPAEGDDEDEITTTGDVQLGGELGEADRGWLKQFVWSRGRDPERTQLIEDYLIRVISEEDVTVEVGTSTQTASGESNYLMVHNDGPRRFGAVTYVNPRSGKLNFRLLEDDIDDVRDRVEVRKIVKGQHHYRINLVLETEDDIELALLLTKRALVKVRD